MENLCSNELAITNKLNIMRNQILQQIRTALGLRNSFFLREIDIQIYLANYFIDSKLFDNIYVEYNIQSKLIPNYPWTDKVYIDIVLEKEGLFYPIEIKYKTIKQTLPLMVFGSNINVSLAKQGATNIGCYSFWKDVKRIEMVESSFKNVERGIVLFVSNDPDYQKAPKNENVGYSQFSIHQGRFIPANSLLNWNGNLKIAKKLPPILIKYDYTINWNPLTNIPNHNYILV